MLKSSSMVPSILVENSLDHRHQPGTSKIHECSLVLWQEEGPHMYPIKVSVNHLQKMRIRFLVKDNSFLQFQKAHIKAHNPIRIFALVMQHTKYRKVCIVKLCTLFCNMTGNYIVSLLSFMNLT